MVSGDKTKNPAKTDPKLLGGKLHVWNDHGPTGYTLTAISREAMRGVPVFAEKLWGVKGSSDFKTFRSRAETVFPVPEVAIFDRVPADRDGVVLELPGERVLAGGKAAIALPAAGAARADLESPWTLTMRVMPSGETSGRGILLSSELAQICADYRREETVSTKFADGTTRKSKVTFTDLGIVRAAGFYQTPGDPSKTYLSHDVSASFKTALEQNRWTTVTLVGTDSGCVAYLDGKKSARRASDKSARCAPSGRRRANRSPVKSRTSGC